MLHPSLDRRLRGIKRAEHIVQHSLGHIVLDHRHMLVSGRVVDRVNPPGTHHIQQPPVIADRAQDRNQLQVQRLATNQLLQLLVNAVKIELAVLEQDQRSRPLGDDLSAQLGAD
ncbi:hypothetical protein D3C84_925030 [compost metagenome]